MIRPPVETKASAVKLANAALSEVSPERLAQLLSESGLLSEERQEEKPQTATLSTAEDSVGIWEARQEGGQPWFVRSSRESPNLWADVERIPPKSHRPRVLLLGESVARGHFYDPGFSFAEALRSVLNFAGAGEIEVIDLARTAQSLSGLVRLLHQSSVLQPDALIIFAGNNWGLSFDTPLQEFANLTRRGGGIADLKTIYEESLIHAARHLVQAAENIARGNGVPAILVVPEFNLKDWHNERAGETPFLGSRERAAWEHARESARRAIAAARWTQAEKFAREMIALDTGTTPAPYEILAEIALLQGDAESARSLLECARDAGLFLPIMRSPRCFRVVQETLRKEGKAQGLTIVDLPQHFHEYLEGRLPDRHLFLDYCHMTFVGLKITAAIVIEGLLALLGKPLQSWTLLREAPLEINPRINAEASFLAAFHNCDWGQPMEIVDFRLREALRIDPTCCHTMMAFLTAWLRQAPLMLCDELVRFVNAQTAIARYFFAAPPSSSEKDWNWGLISLLTSALEPFVPDVRNISNLIACSTQLTMESVDSFSL